jgi:hypothetical protein
MRYKNIELLDLRKMSEEELRGIERIESVETLIIGEGQQDQVRHIIQSQIETVLIIPMQIKYITHNGNYVITKGILHAFDEKVFLEINGSVKVEPIGDKALLEKIFKAEINGRLLAQDLDYATLSDRVQINGETVIYKEGELLLDGRFELNDINLYSLEPSSRLVVSNFFAIEPYDEALFDESVESLRVLDYVVADHLTIRKVAKKISNYLEIEKYIVPEGYQYFDKLTLNAETLKSVFSDKVFVRGNLKIDMNIDVVKEKISRIICKQLEVTEADYDEVMTLVEKAQKIKLIDPNFIQNMSHLNWSSYYFKEVTELSMTNYGKLTIDETVTAEILADKVKKIENYGVIQCSKSIYSEVMKKISLNYGVINVDEQEL